MPRPKKGSPEAMAWAADMRKRREAAKAATKQMLTNPAPAAENDDVGALTARVQELEGLIKQLASQPQSSPALPNAAVGASGALIGTHERYIMRPDYYPNPVERLADEARLARFAFRENYELDWEVGISQYETVDHIRTKEPKFTLKLVVKIFDDDSGELTNRRFVILKGIFHEDPDAAIMIAQQNGLTIDETNQKVFLDEMRYLRFRDWLLEAFYPTPPPPAKNSKEVVIGNKLVTVYEVSSENSESMAGFFGGTPKKL